MDALNLWPCFTRPLFSGARKSMTVVLNCQLEETESHYSFTINKEQLPQFLFNVDIYIYIYRVYFFKEVMKSVSRNIKHHKC